MYGRWPVGRGSTFTFLVLCFRIGGRGLELELELELLALL